MSVGVFCSSPCGNYSAWRYNGQAEKTFYSLKSTHSGFFFSTSVTGTAKIVRILHIWYFTAYVFSVHVKDLYPWGKLELREMCRSFLHLMRQSYQRWYQSRLLCISVIRICLLWQWFVISLPHLLSSFFTSPLQEYIPSLASWGHSVIYS